MSPRPLFPLAAPYWKPPFKYVSEGTIIVDSNGSRILDVRGWGHLTGQGAHALTDVKAEPIQDQVGEHVALLLNANWPAPWHKDS